MTRAQRSQWCEALRSGRWRQIKGRLAEVNGGNGRCCLGVLCELTPGLRWEKRMDSNGGDLSMYACIEGQKDAAQLPMPVVRRWRILPESSDPWISMAALNPNDDRFRSAIMPIGSHTTLARLNDNGYSFAEIADIIEKHLPVEDGP